MFGRHHRNYWRVMGLMLSLFIAGIPIAAISQDHPAFNIEEASIADIQHAVDIGELTYQQLIKMYLAR